jgi:hypothetical protein
MFTLHHKIFATGTPGSARASRALFDAPAKKSWRRAKGEFIFKCLRRRRRRQHARAHALPGTIRPKIGVVSCDVDHEAHVEKQKRRGEKQAIQQIKRTANSWEQISRVFYVGAALDDRFGQIAEDCSKPQ